MRIIKPLRLSYLGRPYRFQKKNYFSITAILFVDFSNGFKLKSEQDLWLHFNDELVKNFGVEAIDLGITKRYPEILISGYGYGVHAKNNRTAVSVSVNNIKKDLWVTGERFWNGENSSEPKPFEKIAISWGNAYGGNSYPLNFAGKGRDYSESHSVIYLPNIESPYQPIRSKNIDYIPVSFSPIPIEYPGRNLLMGTYDEKWREEDFPGFARDIDWSYFNQAWKDQRLNQLEPGDEIRFINLHPEEPLLETKIPNILVKGYFKKNDNHSDKNFLNEIQLDLKTYWGFPHLKSAYLIFQADIPVDEDDASDLSHLLLAVEHGARPKLDAINYYEHIFNLRVGEKAEPLLSMVDKDLVDEEFLGADATLAIEASALLKRKMEILEKKRVALQQKSGKGKATLESRDDLHEMGWSDDDLSAMKGLSRQLDKLSVFKSSMTLDDVLQQAKEAQKKTPSVLEMARKNKAQKKKLSLIHI